MKRRGIAIALIAVLAFGACGSDKKDADSASTDDTTATTTAADDAPMTGSNHRSAVLTGAEEVPGPGDTDATGEAGISQQATGVEETFCYDVNVKGIDKPTAAHIHKGAKGVAGPVVVTLGDLVDDGEGGYTASTCLKVEDALAQDIFANPGEYYVNVHTAAFPNGALRGQLSKASRRAGQTAG